VFNTPGTFDPERYSASRNEDRQPYALFGFGGGRHRCLGMAFAHQQIKVIWGVLLQRYDFRLRDNPAVPDYSTFVVGPRHPCRATYARRGR
jgi:sterol 14-demethylase